MSGPRNRNGPGATPGPLHPRPTIGIVGRVCLSDDKQTKPDDIDDALAAAANVAGIGLPTSPRCRCRRHHGRCDRRDQCGRMVVVVVGIATDGKDDGDDHRGRRLGTARPSSAVVAGNLARTREPTAATTADCVTRDARRRRSSSSQQRPKGLRGRARARTRLRGGVRAPRVDSGIYPPLPLHPLFTPLRGSGSPLLRPQHHTGVLGLPATRMPLMRSCAFL